MFSYGCLIFNAADSFTSTREEFSLLMTLDHQIKNCQWISTVWIHLIIHQDDRVFSKVHNSVLKTTEVHRKFSVEIKVMRVNDHQYEKEFDSTVHSVSTVLNSANRLLLSVIRKYGEQDALETMNRASQNSFLFFKFRENMRLVFCQLRFCETVLCWNHNNYKLHKLVLDFRTILWLVN